LLDGQGFIEKQIELRSPEGGHTVSADLSILPHRGPFQEPLGSVAMIYPRPIRETTPLRRALPLLRKAYDQPGDHPPAQALRDILKVVHELIPFDIANYTEY